MSEEEIIKKANLIIENHREIDKMMVIEMVDLVQGLLDLYNKEKENNKKLEEENKEIRQWKYVIDTYEDLDKLKELDLIKIKGKKYIAENRLQEFKDLLIKELDRDFVTEEYRQGISCYFKELLEERN
jgi:hypothetical protein